MAKDEKMMNRAEESPHKAGGDFRPKPGGEKRGSDVGEEKKAKMNEAFDSNPGLGHGGLKHAVDELHRQHPIKHDDLGPHHGHDHHERHEHLGGLKPRGM